MRWPDASMPALGVIDIHRYVSDDRKFNPQTHYRLMDGGGQKMAWFLSLLVDKMWLITT
jgi:hypothetical protein